MVDPTFLRHYLLIYREGTLARAARVAGLTPSALSLQLKALEHALGATLFQRAPKGLVATAAGHDLAQRVGPAFDDLEHALEHWRADRIAPVVTLGAPADLVQSRLAPALRGLVEDGVRLHLRSGQWEDLGPELRAGTLDLAIGCAELATWAPESMELYTQRYALAGTASWRGQLPDLALGARALADLPFVMLGRDCPLVRGYFRDVFGTTVVPTRAVTVNDMHAMEAAARAGLGLAVLPVEAVTGELLVLHHPPRAAKHTLHLAWRRGALEAPTIARVREHVVQAAAGWS